MRKKYILIFIIILVILMLGVWLFISNSNITQEQIVQRIQIIENNNQDIPSFAEALEDNVDATLIGDKEYFEFAEVDTISVSVLKSNASVIIIPAPDFVNTQKFYFYEDGTLALYNSVSNTIGGECKYYFYKNKLIDVKQNFEENITIQPEKETEIIQRAKLVYDRYMK